MDGLFNLVGPREYQFTAHGKTYVFTVRWLEDFAKFESFLLSRSRNPYIGIDALPEALRVIATAAAAKEAARPLIVSIGEAEDFSDSFPGRGYRVWQSLSKKHPDEFPPNVPAEQGAQLGMDFMEWAGTDRFDEIAKILMQVDEEDILKNSDGPQQTGATTTTTAAVA